MFDQVGGGLSNYDGDLAGEGGVLFQGARKRGGGAAGRADVRAFPHWNGDVRTQLKGSPKKTISNVRW